MKKFWISFIAVLLGVAIGVGIWQGIVHKDKIKVFADKTWSKIESAFKKDTNKQEDTNHNESDGKVFDESSLSGIYWARDIDTYVCFTLMETDPHFMFVSGFTDVPHETFYWCSKSKNAPRNAYVSLEKKYNGQLIYYYYENELKFVYDKDSFEFSIYVKNEKFLFSEKYIPIKSAHEVVPVVFVDEENRLCLEKEYTVSVTYYCRVVGETEWKQIHSYKLNDEIKNGYMVEGLEYEIMCRLTCVGFNCDFCIDSEIIRYTAHFVHPSYGHVWSTEIVQESTCVDEGRSVSTCDICGKVSESTISPKGHNYYFDYNSSYWSEEDEKFMGTWICSRCGDEIVAPAPRTEVIHN